MPRSIRRLLAHWPLKVASLCLAVLLWVLVSAEQVATHWIPVRVEAHVRNPRYVLTAGPWPTEVRVLFAGPGRRLWQLALDRPSLALPIAVPREGGYLLEARMLRLPEGVGDVAVRDIRPVVVRAEVQPLATRTLPVRPRFSRASLARFALTAPAVVSPDSVRVTGPADDLSRMTRLETEPMELRAADSAGFDARVAVDTAGLQHFTLSRTVVRVSGEVEPGGDRLLPDVPVRTVQGSAAGAADLRVRGPSRVLAALHPGDVWVEVTARGPRIRGLPASVEGAVLARRPLAGHGAPRP